MNLRQWRDICNGVPATYRWVVEHTTEPRFVLMQKEGFATLYAAYDSQLGMSWHRAYEQVYYERWDIDHAGEGRWWRLNANDIIFIMQCEKGAEG